MSRRPRATHRSLALAFGLAAAGPAAAAISDRVVDDLSGLPVPGAVVRLQVDAASPAVAADAAGGFALPVAPSGFVVVTASVPYERPAVTRGWPVTPRGGPVEIEVAHDELRVPVEAAQQPGIPTMGPLGTGAFILLIAGVALLLLRRRPDQDGSGS